MRSDLEREVTARQALGYHVEPAQIDRLWNRLTELGFTCYQDAGSNRLVFTDAERTAVVKVPFNSKGLESNLFEAEYCAEAAANGGKIGVVDMPECSMIDDELLRMEYIRANEPLNGPLDQLPAWTWQLKDGPQVGYASDGRIVPYDFGYAPPLTNDTETLYRATNDPTVADAVWTPHRGYATRISSEWPLWSAAIMPGARIQAYDELKDAKTIENAKRYADIAVFDTLTMHTEWVVLNPAVLKNLIRVR